MMHRREFLQILAVAAASGMALPHRAVTARQSVKKLYDLPPFGNVHLLHMTDCHAQLLPLHFREPDTNIGLFEAMNRPPHLVGQHLLDYFGIKPETAHAHAFTYLDFEAACQQYGKVGGFAHLATLVKQLRASRPGALLLDGGDTWQGSATALWTQGQDMVDACVQLGVDIMTGHWEFTLGADRVTEIIENDFHGKLDFVAQNVEDQDFGDPVFPAYSLREMNGVQVGIIGQAFPYTPIANPSHFIPEWSFGIQERRLQETVEEVRSRGAKVVVLLSHNGMDVDLKLASRVQGLDAILGGHTHDGVPRPMVVSNGSGKTLVTNAGSHGKFLGVLDFDVQGSQVVDFHYKLLPVFSDYLDPDADMTALIDAIRAPFAEQLAEPLAITDELLYRRGNFNGTFDQVILDALMAVKDAEIAFSPGFRWGPSLLPGHTITMEDLMNQTAITYPQTTLVDMPGSQIKVVLEDVADNLFNEDPYYQQGGDMVRVGGLQYAFDPQRSVGERVTAMALNGKLIDADRSYKVASWAPVAAGVEGEPVWDVVARYLRDKKVVQNVALNLPTIKGLEGNKGWA